MTRSLDWDPRMVLLWLHYIEPYRIPASACSSSGRAYRSMIRPGLIDLVA